MTRNATKALSRGRGLRLPGRFLALFMACLLSSTSLAQSSYEEQEAMEVERLKSLLKNYYAEEERRANEASASLEELDSSAELSGDTYEFTEVALSGTEGRSALEHMSQRLEDDAMPALRRETDIIFNVEVRQNGKLVSSKAHSLKALGKSQYIAKISMLAGDAVITVRKNQWEVSIAGDPQTSSSSDYLVTLNAPRDRDPELHIISVDDLRATNWTEMPPWLPFIGTLPSQS